MHRIPEEAALRQGTNINHAENSISSSELLEEMLEQGDIEFFPKLRKRVDRFIDVMNHNTTQNKLKQYRNDFERHLNHIEESSSVFDMMQKLRKLIDDINDIGINSPLQSLQQTGFENIMSDDTLSFLDNDELTIEQRVDRFFVVREQENSPNEITDLAFEIISDIRQAFEPLKEKLVPIEKAKKTFDGINEHKSQTVRDCIVGATLIAAVSSIVMSGGLLAPVVGMIVPVVSGAVAGGATVGGAIVGGAKIVDTFFDNQLRRGRFGWFEDTAKYLINYVKRNDVDDEGLRHFLESEDLEKDLPHFKLYLNQWIRNFGISGFRHAMNPAYNRIYSTNGNDKADGFIPTWFSGSLNRGGEPYYCPIGWRRYAIDVGMTAAQFEQEYGKWPVAYHGTKGALAMSILINGLKASGQGCFLQKKEGAVYLSPSIEYSGHPRYAKILSVKSKYVQMVLQVRIDSRLIEKHPGTLRGAMPYDREKADPHFSNDELEWIIRWKPEENIKALNGILVYGLMFRVTDEHPGRLPQNQWWKKTQPEYWDFELC
ncbi:unnamed protein product [Adineta steineri]|uniref:Uncharacterized protein n=1 Tax=Adineta steineri TaxID=433720 RepID=A0A816F7X7_9BILA|nr:unnamed protein product [Adineta steineri]CAF1537472.1 unnamed protein product [Adineta steineri]CAF1656122.1 unnamed protein product [Adineta steineri]CAF1656128.1 unnamed protein product [Adineta steineri]